MARTIQPGTPTEINAKQYDVKQPDFSAFEKLGDAKIRAANANFKLYAQNLLATEQQKLFEQYNSDPVNLANALSKLPGMISDLPEEIQTQMNSKLYISSVGLIQKAQNNQLILQDQETKVNADKNIKDIMTNIIETYGNVMQSAKSPAEDKNYMAADQFLSQIDDLQELTSLKDHNGKDIYSETQKKQILNISDAQMEAGKRFIDSMILNDDNELSQTKEYYQQFVLAPERFMKDNYMDRGTYDKFREYAEKRIKQAGVEIKGMKFKQSLAQATALQQDDLPGTLEELKKDGIIDKKIIDQIEKTNVKFNEIDPSKAETPAAMIDMLRMVNSWSRLPDTATEGDKMQILAQGAAALDSIADYAKEYGLSPKSVARARKMIVMKEQDVVFADMLDKFGAITQSFGESIPDMERKLNVIRGEGKPGEFGMSDLEMAKLIRLNDVLAQATDESMEAIRTQDALKYNQVQQELSKRVAQIKYMGIIRDADWVKWEENPDTPISLPGGRIIKVLGFTPDGDVIIDK